MDKKEIESFAKMITEEFINSSEFKSIIKSSIEYGFYAGLKFNSRDDVVSLLYAKEEVFDKFWKVFKQIKEN